MALDVIRDLIRDTRSDMQYTFQGVATYISIDRAFLVTGLIGTDTDKIPTTATNYIKGIIPVTTPHPVETQATAREYRMGTIESADAAWVVVSFLYNQGGFPQTVWQIQCSNFLEAVETDTQFDDNGNLVPILVDNYTPSQWSLPGNLPDSSDPNVTTEHHTGYTSYFKSDEADGSKNKSAYAVVQVWRPRKRLIMTRTIYDAAKAAQLDAAGEDWTGAINSVLFRNRQPFTWMCMDVDVTFDKISGINTGTLEFVYRPEGWYPFARFSNRELGVPANIFKAYNNGVFDAENSNGIIQAKSYLKKDLNQLVNLIN